MKKITYLNQRSLMDFLNEKYSINNSIDELSQEIVDVCLPKFKWWQTNGRKRKYSKGIKPGNFVDIFNFSPKTKDRNFNIIRMNIKLVFVLTSEEEEINSSGYCFTFGDDNPKKNPLSPKRTKMGIEVGMEIRIFVPRRSKKDFTKDVIEKIYEIGTHELTHLFQSYKIDQKGLVYEDYEVTLTLLDFSSEIIARYSDEGNLFSILTSLMYICLTKSETDAYLAQAGSKSSSGDFWVEYIDWFRSKPKGTILKNIKKELEKEKIDEETFIDILNKIADINSADFSSIETIDDFLEWGYSVINRKKNYLLKKVGKIKYQKSISE